jgi:hypothetical protein
MAIVKFGAKQLGKPTPQRVSVLADFLAGFCGILSGFITTAEFVPHKVSDIASPILTALFIPMALYVKRFFGTQLPANSEVKVSDVSEVKESINKQ